VLAIAVLGIVMVKAFGARLEQSLAKLPIAQNIVQEIRLKEVELVGLEPPQGLGTNAIAAIRRAISDAFLGSFRLVLVVCAALSVASAIVAGRLIGVSIERRAGRVVPAD
jgi:hypothetical protein